MKQEIVKLLKGNYNDDARKEIDWKISFLRFSSKKDAEIEVVLGEQYELEKLTQYYFNYSKVRLEK